MSTNVIIGVNILETLTTGMYRDPLVIFREYIQNSCDAIDDAVKGGLFESDAGHIDIWIKNNDVVIEDNGIGIPAEKFKETLYSIGESQKTAGVNKGFRGIGHWCGFAHCSTLVFTAKAAGESIESVMHCDAAEMRSMMLSHRLKLSTYSIDDVLSNTTKFSTRKVSDTESHYFKVEMLDITDAKDELCDLQSVKDYLSFIIPVGYATAFRFRKKIHEYANSTKYSIQEYSVKINGESILKNYKPSFTTHGKGEDSITDIKFKEFRDNSGNLIAWMWFGISTFKAQMVAANRMRGIRLRSHNIQIGGEDALQRLFKESNGRGLYYYIGEVFAISNDLLPDSQRDYFEPCEIRVKFESLLSDFFNDELKDIYYAGSKINSAFDKIEKAKQISEEFSKFNSISDTQKAELNKAQSDAKKAALEIEKLQSKQIEKDAGIVGTIVDDLIKKNKTRRSSSSRLHKSDITSESVEDKRTATPVVVTLVKDIQNERFVSLCKVVEIVRGIADTSTADEIIAKIEKELL